MRAIALAIFVMALGACAASSPTIIPPNVKAPYAGYASAKYRDAKLWLCRPDMPSDACRSGLDATELHADGSRTIVPFVPAPHPEVDCFYVYPTVDMGVFAYNHTDFDDVSAMASTTRAQAARFGEACAMYVPLYRQISIGGYFWGDRAREKLLEVAFSDVLDAFLHYMGQYNHGRKVVLIGHSQGAEMVIRLLRRVFENDPAMRERLVVAMAIGGRVDVAKNSVTGGSLAHIPMCMRDDELGCVIAYRTFRLGHVSAAWNAPEPGHVAMCVNPAKEGSREPQTLARTYLPSGPAMKKLLHGIEDVTTPFVVLRDFYRAECVSAPDGNDYLGVREVNAANDRRVSPFPLDAPALNEAHGMHVLDLQLPQGDLIDLVKRKAARATNE